MKSPNDLWEVIGNLAEDEPTHVLARLFTMYEEMLARDPANEQALLFFRNLDTVLGQTTICNLNRR